MFNNRSRVLFFILFVAIFVFSVYYFSEIKKEVALLGKINVYWLMAAIISQAATYFFTAVAYYLLLDCYRLKQSPGIIALYKASVILLFFNQTMPSIGVSGNTFMFNFLEKLQIRAHQILTLMLVELLIFYVAMESLILLLLTASFSFHPATHFLKATLGGGFIIYIVFGMLVLLAGRKTNLSHLFKKLLKIRILKKIFNRLIKKLLAQGIAHKEVNLLKFLKDNKLTTLKVLLFELLVISADGCTIYALFNGLGIHISIIVVLFGLVGTKIISIIPFLPGSLLLYESSMSFIFIQLGVPAGTAVIVTLVYRLLSFWFPIPVGLWLYRKWSLASAVKDTSVIG